MIQAVLVLGILFTAAGVAVMVSPQGMIRFVVDRFRTRGALYAAAAARLVIGCVFVLASPESRSPAYLWYFGVLAILAGAVLPFMGLERFKRLVGWVASLDVSLVRAWGFVVVALGLSFVWAAL
ncbi:MAG: hypothetical protein JRG76_14245 [Deltaproteobacteria bacterium]|nr:hypothetical protein [Deltaproteobacteria bacterium]MBW2415662.1 hypothetical protein [Deltaproteobacteria bacterium]